MKQLKNIALLILLLATGRGVVAQETLDFDKAYAFAQGGQFDSAQVYISRYVKSAAAASDASGWYLYGFIHQRLYRMQEMSNPLSPMRLEAKKGFMKSFELDKSAENRSRNREGFCSLSLSFYNSAVQTLNPVNYQLSVTNFNWYKEVVVFCDTNINLKGKEIEFNLALATMFEDTLARSKNKDTASFYKARDAYMRVLQIDPVNIKANYNIGVLYHNFAVNLIMNTSPDEDLGVWIKTQEEADVLFKKALPFGEFGLNLPDSDPKKLEYLNLLYQIYNNIYDTEKATKFKQMIDTLEKNGGK